MTQTKWEDARRVLVEGFFPHMTDADLHALNRALSTDDCRLIQGATTEPPPLVSEGNSPCMGGCFVSYPAAVRLGGFGFPKEDDRRNRTAAKVVDVEEAFATLCFRCDQTLGEPAACRHFLNWFDDAPRADVLREVGREVADELLRRYKSRPAA